MQLSFLESLFNPVIPSAVHPERINIQDLRTHIPESSMGYILDWFAANPVHLRISKARSSKFGDYRSSSKNVPARISVNRNLNRFDFLLTLVHEMAHHEELAGSPARTTAGRFYRKNKRPGPHGKEWRMRYRTLMAPLLNDQVFPEDLLSLLAGYFENPRSSPKMNRWLVAALHKYDDPDGSVLIEMLAINTVFSLPGGRKFRKREKLRKRYRCECLDNGKSYLVSPGARVFPITS